MWHGNATRFTTELVRIRQSKNQKNQIRTEAKRFSRKGFSRGRFYGVSADAIQCGNDVADAATVLTLIVKRYTSSDGYVGYVSRTKRAENRQGGKPRGTVTRTNLRFRPTCPQLQHVTRTVFRTTARAPVQQLRCNSIVWDDDDFNFKTIRTATCTRDIVSCYYYYLFIFFFIASANALSIRLA